MEPVNSAPNSSDGCHCLGGGCFDCRPDTGPPPGTLTDEDLDGSPDQFETSHAPKASEGGAGDA